MHKDKKSLKSVLRTEMQYQKILHARDAQERPDRYKVNNLSEDQMKVNLMILLARAESEDGEHLLFHTEDEIMELLIEHQPDEEMEKDEEPYEKQEAIAVIWDTESGERVWHIGFYFGKNVDGSS